MRRALELAGRGGVRTRPNPNVGAVVVRHGRVVGEGWHRALGREHAEVVAIARAGGRARGATLYVTLEPCAHVGRTAPCTDAIVRSGIRRCVVAVRDPHAIVDGRGLRRLRAAGVRIETGLLAAEARARLGGYWHVHTARRPRVTWKVAMTLDGRVADAGGRSRWITGAAARREGHRLRALADAVVVGAGTARADDPRLTVRLPGARRQPLRVVVDSRLELPLGLRLFGPALARGTVVACAAGASPARAATLERRGVRVWRMRARGRVRPLALLERLAGEGVQETLLECGPALGTPWLRAGVVDRIAAFVAPRLLGAEGLGWLGPLARRRLDRALAGSFTASRRLGGDAFLMFEVGR